MVYKRLSLYGLRKVIAFSVRKNRRRKALPSPLGPGGRSHYNHLVVSVQRRKVVFFLVISCMKEFSPEFDSVEVFMLSKGREMTFPFHYLLILGVIKTNQRQRKGTKRKLMRRLRTGVTTCMPIA